MWEGEELRTARLRPLHADHHVLSYTSTVVVGKTLARASSKRKHSVHEERERVRYSCKCSILSLSKWNKLVENDTRLASGSMQVFRYEQGYRGILCRVIVVLNHRVRLVALLFGHTTRWLGMQICCKH